MDLRIPVHPARVPTLTALLMTLPVVASAEPPIPLVFEEVALPGETTLDRGTVGVSLHDSLLFAGNESTHRVTMKGRRARVATSDGHPTQSHHASSLTIAMANDDALALLFDDRRKMKIAAFHDDTWAQVDRPLGFVYHGHAALSDRIVFPQSAASSAWFVYTSDGFSKEERSEKVAGCSGSVIRTEDHVIATGLDSDDSPCAIAWNASRGTWRSLPTPPVAICDAGAIRSGKHVYLTGEDCEASGQMTAVSLNTTTLEWTTERPPAASLANHHLVSTSSGFAAWSIDRGSLKWQVYDARKKSWSVRRESVAVDARVSVRDDAQTWYVAGRLAGRPSLLQVNHAPEASARDRERSRTLVSPPTEAENDVDWTTASDAERRAGVVEGVASVERYVPPERDAEGKVTTKGAWVFALGEELFVWPVPPKRCKAFIEKLMRKWPTRSIGEQWEVELGDGFARSKEELLYGHSSACREVTRCASEFFTRRSTPLSIVGPIFSYATHTTEANCDGETTSSEQWFAVDLHTGKPAKMTTVIQESSLLEALKKHKTLRRHLKDAAKLEEVLDTLRALDPEGFDGFAFAGWRKATREVELRIEYHPKSPDMVDAVRLFVKPRPEYITVFEAASRAEGALMRGR